MTDCLLVSHLALAFLWGMPAGVVIYEVLCMVLDAVTDFFLDTVNWKWRMKR